MPMLPLSRAELMKFASEGTRASLECDDCDFRPRSQPQRRAPRAGSISRIDLQIAKTLQAVVKLRPDALCHQRPGKELAPVCMSGELQRDPFLFADGKA